MKYKKTEVNYGKGSPIRNCGICQYYRGSSCTKVEGDISPFGLSDIFKMHKNPFGSTLTDAEKAAIEKMAAR